MTEDENRSAHEARLPLSARVPEAYKLADRIAREAVEREEKRGFKVPCSKGCAACCRSLVRVSIPEALYIAERLLESERPWRDEILERFQQARETLEQNGFAETLERDLVREPGDVSYDHRLHLLSRRYLALALPCPFLVEETCSIYSWRPITCRQYLVTSPAHWCVDPFANNVRRVSLPLNVTDLLAQGTTDVLGEPFRMIALPLAVQNLGSGFILD
jgi:Fe-S-cluster containining protein